MNRQWLFVMAILLSSVSSIVFGAEPRVLYVAVDGNDSWSGATREPNALRTDGPLATLAGARDGIRRLKAQRGLSTPVTVRVRAGRYRLNEPFVLEPLDSGTAECPITYVADGDETPVFSGGRAIEGWREAGNRVWTTTIPEVASGQWYFQSLFVNGERRTRARMPNEGFFRAVGTAPARRDLQTGKDISRAQTAFRFRDGDIRKWDPLGEVNVITCHSWTQSRFRIAAVDTDNNIVEFTGPSRYEFLKWDKQPRYYVENLPEALDAPGEWYLDRRTGVLSYIPLPGEDMHKAEVIAPVLTQLVHVRGDADTGKLVEHVKFSGLAFVHADWILKPEGESYSQSAITETGTGVTPAVLFEGARNCHLEKLEVGHVGGYGIALAHGCQNNRVEQCHIHDLGAGGVCLGETRLPKDEAARGERNTVYNCFIHDGGRVYASGVGVWIGRSSYNEVSHNEISDFFYTGISVGWSWGYQPSSAHHNILEYNHIHHLGYGVLSDMGGIYTLGVASGTVLRNNLIHHVESYSYGGWGLYPDEGSTSLVLENNVVYRCKSAGFHQHYGRENVVRNNVFAFGRENQLMRTRNEEHRSFVFEGNIVYFDSGNLLGSNWEGDLSRFLLDRNVYWDASGREIAFDGHALEEWRARGQDQNSIIADPLFVDPETYDFRLQRNSPALKLGFKSIDASRVGLVGSSDWVARPKSVKRNWPEPPAK